MAALHAAEWARDQLQQDLTAARREAEVGVAALQDTNAALASAVTALQLELQTMQNSTIWRATGPLRRMLTSLPRLHRLTRRAARVVSPHAPPIEDVDGAGDLATSLDVPAEMPPAMPTASAARPVVDYAAWIACHSLVPAELDLQRRLIEEFSHQPLISVLTPVYQVEADVLDDTIRSVVGQVYQNWELCLAVGDTSDAPRATVIRRWAAADPRVRVDILTENGGISRNSNAALAMAKGEWAVLLDHDDLLTPDALFHLVRTALADPDAAMIYSDKDLVGADGTIRQHPLFKPAWSPDIMLNANYLTQLNMMPVDRIRAVGGWDPETEGAQDWDLFFRVIGAQGKVVHIPRVLYHWRQVPTSTSVDSEGVNSKPYASVAQIRAVSRYMQGAGWAGAAVKFDGTTLRAFWPARWRPSVSLLVVGNGTALRQPACVWPDGIEVLAPPGIVPAGSVVGDTAAVLDALVAVAQGDVLVIVDARLEPQSEDWLRELVGPLANPAIAMVAGAVMRPDGVIEAFGAFCVDGDMGMGFRGLHRSQGGPFGQARWYGNASAAPLRFSALRRADWRNLAAHRAAGRPDLSMTLELAQRRGRILLNPFATAIARGPDPFTVTDPEALRNRVTAVLPDGDPFVSPHLVFAKTGWLTFRTPSSAVAPDHDFAAEARHVAGAYDTTADLVAASVAACAAAPASKLASVCWVVPTFDVPFYGGIHTILRTAEFMRTEHDVRQLFSVIGMTRGRGTPDAMRATMARAFPGLAAAARIEVLGDVEQNLTCGPVDAMISTLWPTAFPALRAKQVRRKFYFLQDWEPLLYPAGSISAMVEAAYRFGFHAICNTPTLAESYRALGGTAEHFMPSVDPKVFRPRRQSHPERSGPFRLFCYTRPATPRNGFETLAVALRELKRRHGEGIDVVTAGADWQPQTYGLEGVVRHLGVLPYEDTGALYRACDAGLVAMATQHPSYLPFEFMASGTAVITNRNAHTAWLLRDGENAALCELAHSDIVRAVEVVMYDMIFRNRIVQGGYETIRNGHADWSATCAAIYNSVDRVCRGVPS
jgi:cellulose synthase/poly-beta-1,6-N-acetylglucosamine synthase-like glycosyltransferase/glycosyltransferase involved in cell wall biosynthesis